MPFGQGCAVEKVKRVKKKVKTVKEVPS